jgi:hypothetical protein
MPAGGPSPNTDPMFVMAFVPTLSGAQRREL